MLHNVNMNCPEMCKKYNINLLETQKKWLFIDACLKQEAKLLWAVKG